MEYAISLEELQIAAETIKQYVDTRNAQITDAMIPVLAHRDENITTKYKIVADTTSTSLADGGYQTIGFSASTYAILPTSSDNPFKLTVNGDLPEGVSVIIISAPSWATLSGNSVRIYPGGSIARGTYYVKLGVSAEPSQTLCTIAVTITAPTIWGYTVTNASSSRCYTTMSSGGYYSLREGGKYVAYNQPYRHAILCCDPSNNRNVLHSYYRYELFANGTWQYLDYVPV